MYASGPSSTERTGAFHLSGTHDENEFFLLQQELIYLQLGGFGEQVFQEGF
jgi:hypothetical protein